jgi:hypothetical protein
MIFPGWDSMTHIALVIEVEFRFDIEFPTMKIKELTSVGDLAANDPEETRSRRGVSGDASSAAGSASEYAERRTIRMVERDRARRIG